MTKLALFTFATGMQPINSWRRSPSFAYRIRKYMGRGYGIYLPEVAMLATNSYISLISKIDKIKCYGLKNYQKIRNGNIIKYKWLIKAIENICYLDKPLPPMP